MKILEGIVQGSPAWKAVRAKYPCASEAPIVMGASRHMTRAELLRLKAAGMEKEFSDYVQRTVLDKGHQVEGPARAITEEQIGEPLFPATAVSDDDAYLASLDGITMIEATMMEHKQWSEELAAAIRAGATEFPDGQEWQLEQQLIVAESAEKVIFVCSDGTAQRRVQMEYRRVPGRAEQLKAGWRQFYHDLEHGDHTPAPVKAVAAPMQALPAVSVRMDGALQVVSNLDSLGPLLRAFIDRIPAKPTTDEDFATTDAACKALKKLEEALDAAEASALASLDAVESMQRLKASLHKLARDTRLQREKLVEARKLEIRTEEIARGKQALSAFIDGLNATVGKPYMPQVPNDFAGKIKGLRTVQSVRDAVDQHLADCKLIANEIAGKIMVNLRTLRELASEHAFLFADTATLVLKAPDDCRAIIDSRIQHHKDAEAVKEADTRERIRREEQQKLAREQEAREAEERRQRAAAEEQQRQEHEARAEQERQQQAPASATLPTGFAGGGVVGEGADAVRIAVTAPGTAAAAPAVVAKVRQLPPRQSPPCTPPALRLGQINERLAPLSITAEGLAALGFAVVATDKSAKLYFEQSFDGICDAIIAQVAKAKLRRREAA